jgi:hypothetical protein
MNRSGTVSDISLVNVSSMALILPRIAEKT